MKIGYLLETAKDVLKENAPEILLGVGVLGVGIGTFMACKATMHVKDPINNFEMDKKVLKTKLEEADYEDSEAYSQNDYNRDICKLYLHLAWDYCKLYGPAFLTMFFAMLSIFKSHGMLAKSRDLYAAAFTATLSEFNKYRGRVVEKYGEEEDRMLRHGSEIVTVTDVDEKGKTTTEEYVVSNPYTFVFDNGNKNWTSAWDRDSNWDMPKAWLIMIQNELQTEIEHRAKHNDICPGVGILKLNELYKKVGLPTTELGDRAIWIYINNDVRINKGLAPLPIEGDNHIDLRLFCTSVKNNDFVSGLEKCIYIDPNIDGDIYTLNKKYHFRPIK